MRAQAASFQSLAVGVAAHGRLGSDHDNLLIARGRCRSLGAGLDHPYDRDVRGCRDAVQSQCRGCITGDDEHLRTLGFEEVGSFHGVSGNSLNRF